MAPPTTTTTTTTISTSSMQMEVRVNGLSGSLVSVFLVGGDTVAALKAQLSEKAKIPPSEQQLLSGERMLQDTERLEAVLELSDPPEPPEMVAVAEVTLVRRSPDLGRWVEKVKANWTEFISAPAEARACRDVVMEAVKKEGKLIRFASADLKKDKQVALAAVNQVGAALQFLDPPLRNDPEVVMTAVSRTGMALEHAPAEARNDRNIVAAAVRSSGDALQFASEELRNDSNFMIPMLSINGLLIRYIGEDLKMNQDLAMIAVLQNKHAYKHCPPAIKNHPLILKAMGIDPDDV